MSCSSAPRTAAEASWRSDCSDAKRTAATPPARPEATPARPCTRRCCEALQEIGIDASDHVPHRLDDEAIQWADVVVATCDDACPVVPGQALHRLAAPRPQTRADRARPRDPRRHRPARPRARRRARPTRPHRRPTDEVRALRLHAQRRPLPDRASASSSSYAPDRRARRVSRAGARRRDLARGRSRLCARSGSISPAAARRRSTWRCSSTPTGRSRSPAAAPARTCQAWSKTGKSPDPAGRPLDEVREIRDELERRVRDLIENRARRDPHRPQRPRPPPRTVPPLPRRESSKSGARRRRSAPAPMRSSPATTTPPCARSCSHSPIEPPASACAPRAATRSRASSFPTRFAGRR